MGDVAIPQDWDGETYECYSVKWPASFEWRAVLNGLIDRGATGWTYEEKSGNVIAARDAIRATLEYNLRNEVCIMSCNEDTIAELAGIRAALEGILNKACCPTGGAGSGVFNSGSRGAGITPEIINPYTENPELEEPPVGFDSWAEYRTHKCNAAADLVQNLKIDLLSLSNLIPEGKMFTVIVAELVAVLLTPIPYDDLASIVGWLVVAGFEYSLLAELSTGIQDDEDNLRCILYNSVNADSAQIDFKDRVFELIGDVSGLGLAQTWLEGIVTNLTPNDAFNRVFENVSTTIQDADCSGCVAEWTPVEGIYASGNLSSNPMIVESVFLNGLHRAYICRETGTDNVTFGPISGFTPAPSTGGADDAVGVATEGCSGTVTYSLYLDDDYPEDSTFNDAAFIGLNSSTAFTFEVTRS